MSQTAGGSRLTNSNNSVNGSDAGISDSEETRDIPLPSERLAEFYAEYPDLAGLQVTRQEGERVREKFAETTEEAWQEDQPDTPQLEHKNAVTGYRTTRVDPVTWGEAVEIALRNYEETRRTTINLERGRPSDAEYSEFSVESETRWFASYQKRYFAQIQAWVRELTGGERPSGGASDPVFSDPHVVLLTRSASAVPDGERLAPLDHARELQGAWEPCYHTLRNTLRREGYELGDGWQYERRMEPHAGDRGGGVNHCYTHEHTVILVDGEVDPDTFAPVLEKHVDECDPAGPDAHQVGEAVEVFEADELEDIASYVAAYSGVEPSELLERDTEYIAWAATMDAGNIRTKSRSDAAKHAATADQCKQQCEDPRTEQDSDHAEEVRPSLKRGYEYECSHCGSPHGVDQDPDTLTEARLSADDGGGQAACDGGFDVDAVRRNDLRERWEDARAAASVGETPTRKRHRGQIERELERTPEASTEVVLGRGGLPPDRKDLVREVAAGADRSNPIGFGRAPSWRVKSVEIGEDEFPASAGSGVDMVETMNPSGERGNLRAFRGRETPMGTVERVCRRFKASGSSVTVECMATGETFDAGESHLLVATEEGRAPVRDVSALAQWCAE